MTIRIIELGHPQGSAGYRVEKIENFHRDFGALW